MNTSELIELLREYEAEAGEPVPVHVLVRVNESKNDRVQLSEWDFEMVDSSAGNSVLIDLS